MLRRRLGFTLVELMITIAIIGVLATLGVPAFRTMVQRAKKSEAKVGLAGLYTAETTFFSEYGTYGNVFDRIGFDLEGSDSGRLYSIGFLNNSCAVVSSGTAIPQVGSIQGSALNLAFPNYYTGTILSIYPAVIAPTGTCGTAAFIGSISATDYRATAYGIIAPGVGVIADGWTIDRQRNLLNVQDGLHN